MAAPFKENEKCPRPRFDQDQSLKKYVAANYPTAICMLRHGRLDVVIMPDRLWDYLIRDVKTVIRKSPYTEAGRPSFIAVSRKLKLAARLEDLSATLRDIRSDGSIAKITARYR